MSDDFKLNWYREKERVAPDSAKKMDKFLSMPFSALPYVHSMGVSLFDPVHAVNRHAGTRCELIYILSGNLRLVIGKKRFSAEQGDILIMPPGTTHLDEFDPAKGLKAFMVFFSWNGAAPFFEQVDNNTLKSMADPVKHEAGRILDDMRLDFTGDEHFDRLAACARLHVLLILFFRNVCGLSAGVDKSESPGKRHRQKLFAGAKAWLELNFQQEVTLDMIARELGVSAFYLSHAFSEEGEFSLFAYLTMLRMNKAMELLADGQKNVSETAFEIGYTNSNSFTKAFRRHFGKPPSAFRHK